MAKRKQPKIKVRKTPYGLHLYIATIKGESRYGWGDTPQEARDRLLTALAKATD